MNSRRTVLLGVATALLATPAFARRSFRRLFNGRNTDGWTPLGDANWRVEDGVLRADRGTISFLVSRESYRDFELHVEFRVSLDANSGIFIRCSDRARITASNSYEVNIYDTRPDPTYGTGAIVDVAKVVPMPKAAGKWNTFDITAKGDHLVVIFNGQKTVDVTDKQLLDAGPIALQYGSGSLKWRKVQIRAL